MQLRQSDGDWGHVGASRGRQEHQAVNQRTRWNHTIFEQSDTFGPVATCASRAGSKPKERIVASLQPDLVELGSVLPLRPRNSVARTWSPLAS
jgi:hypothetical protein